MTEATVDALAAATTPTLIDVREPNEYQDGHIEGAINIPLGDLADGTRDVPNAHPVYVICHSGKRSAQGAQILTDHGLDAVSIRGGMSEWEASGHPTVV
ncbi:rhodanese-like domain-containing protein [Frondihabitans peucedani]|uniref:Rhodanese-like domain-containing protein n=1 Tax=Frondihabitans peucedani TaxID=598626 RepID=A0ABP8E307_9MICO